MLSRRAAIAGALAAPLLPSAHAEPAPTVRVGVLRFGTVQWEIDVIRHHSLDQANGISIEAVEYASSQATQVALQGGAVASTAQDWLWVARQRAEGADWTFSGLSTAIGAVVAPEGSPVRAITDLPGRRLGVAGSPLDKSWIILRAFARTAHGIDLDATATKNFGPPPLLAAQMAAGRLDAVLTFWPFAARAMAAGARRVLAMEDAVRGLGITGEVPAVGYVFAEAWARQTPRAAAGLLAASAAARQILASDDGEWTRIQPLMGAADAAEAALLRDRYRGGIPRAAPSAQLTAAGQLLTVLAATGGPALLGPALAARAGVPPGTFWQAG